MYQPTKLPDADPQTKPADPFTLEALASWLETKPANETYCWENTGHCLFAQYGLYLGLGKAGEIFDDAYTAVLQNDVFGMPNSLPSGLRMERTNIALFRPHTFGAALARTRAEIARRSQQGA